jgi:hypothetical protein
MLLPSQPVHVLSPSLPMQMSSPYELLSMFSQLEVEFSDSKAMHSQPVEMLIYQLAMFLSQPVQAYSPSPTTVFEPSHFLAMPDLPDKSVTLPHLPVGIMCLFWQKRSFVNLQYFNPLTYVLVLSLTNFATSSFT